MEKGRNNIELRSGKVRNIIGQIPPFWVRTGTIVIISSSSRAGTTFPCPPGSAGQTIRYYKGRGGLFLRRHTRKGPGRCTVPAGPRHESTGGLHGQ
ncbi:MAG: hypothetical protein LKF48_04165 [Prevotella sp.]|nr:hypothetical protein [Prevotella sp.]MCH4182349.1 hypothetical protein [Prevotella sp.]MCH4212492.1 hypothetical protein [Prevotella sp.]MCH4240723.1 hypothetical protein [Prevotella sp.]